MDRNWKKQRISFFFGAGATKAVFPSAPLGDDLLPAILNYIQELNNNENSEIMSKAENLKNFIDNIYGSQRYVQNNLPRIEDVLSLLDYNIKKRVSIASKIKYEDVVDIRNDLVYFMCIVLDKALRGYNSKIMEEFVCKLNNIENPKISLISTNYDIVLDNQLQKKDIFNYGVLIRTTLEHESLQSGNHEMAIGIGGKKNFLKAKSKWEKPISQRKENSGKIPLFKLHGSLNWLWCPRCEEIDITFLEKGALWTQKGNFICVSEYCTSPYQILLVSPTMFKVYDNRIIKEVWKEAEQVISHSDYIIFIGYSLSKADIHIRCMLTKAIASAENRPKILVVDYKKDNNQEKSAKLNKTGDRYKHLLGENVKFRTYGFEYFVKNIDDEINNFINDNQ